MTLETPYYQFNREERNHAAILYHLLLSSTANLASFLKLSNHTATREMEKCEVYYEFAMLRDLWEGMDKKDKGSVIHPNEESKRLKFVLDLLPPRIKTEVEKLKPTKWNDYFQVAGKRSTDQYQSPGRWSPSSMDKLSAEEHEVLSKIKWCFNIKPDLVIITGDREAVCVEAKMESGQSSYPSSVTEVARWNALGIKKKVTQVDCQQYLFKEILKFKEVQHVVLSAGRTPIKNVESITWKGAFNSMASRTIQPFVKHWLEENRLLNSQPK